MAVEIGSKAPDFELQATSTAAPPSCRTSRAPRTSSCSSTRALLTGVCTGELCALRDELP